MRGLTFTLALFFIIVLHELGHALTAKRFGIRTRDITLLPIGGVARLERMPNLPRQELLIARAGPALNVVLAALLFGVLYFRTGTAALTDVKLVEGSFLARLAWVNVSLAAFNLLPAFPMDGGRVLRSVLAMRLDYVRATNIAATIGQVLAVVFGIVGLIANPFLALIAVFVWIGAAEEAGATRRRSALAGLPVERVMRTQFRTLAPDEPLARAIEHVLAGGQHDFPVVEHGQVVGVLRHTDLLTGLARAGSSALVGSAMQRRFRTVRATDDIAHVLNRLREDEGRTLAVLQDGKIVGLFTAENLAEYAMMQTAQEGSTARAPGETTQRILYSGNGTDGSAG